MKTPYKPVKQLTLLFTMTLLLCFSLGAFGQKSIIINMAAIDGIDITPDNILNFQVQSTFPTNNATIKGVLHFRGSNMSLSYTFNYTLRPGMNIISGDMIRPQWQFSSSALRELFMTYKKLPEGTYEYCVTISPDAKVAGDNPTQNNFDECLYHRSDDVFLINLLDPENNAKIHELNPMLSWTVNYPFASELTYRVRVAPIQQGQNPQNAITRNNPVYDENNLMQQSIVYPIYAKPLVVNQPYAWTVDAYFKGILLGGAEDWKFTIVEDSLLARLPVSRSYIDITLEKGNSLFYAEGKLKLKYVLQETRTDTLTLQVVGTDQKEIKLQGNKLAAAYGDNRYEVNLKDSCRLRHMSSYKLLISSKNGGNYTLPFKYMNPDFVH